MRRRHGVGLAAVLVGCAALAATTAGAVEHAVLVLRGQGSPPPEASVVAPPPAVRALAGERLWLIEGERLIACRLERTTRVDQRRIRCAQRGLPRTGGR